MSVSAAPGDRDLFENADLWRDALAEAEAAGLLVLTAKTRLRLLPPLILSEADVAKALAILDDVLSSI